MCFLFFQTIKKKLKTVLLRILLYRSIKLQHVCESVQLNHKKESVEPVPSPDSLILLRIGIRRMSPA